MLSKEVDAISCPEYEETGAVKVEGVPANTAAAANHSSCIIQLLNEASTFRYLIMYAWVISTAAVQVGTPSTNLQTSV